MGRNYALPVMILLIVLTVSAGCIDVGGGHSRTHSPGYAYSSTASHTYPTSSTLPPPTTFRINLPSGAVRVKVVHVVDGDTMDVVFEDGARDRVRFLGVDTPETTASMNKRGEYDHITDLECLAHWGLKAKEYTRKNLEGKYVYLVFDPLAGRRGYYGRLLAYVYYNGEDFTAELVKKGYARAYVEGQFKKKAEYSSYQELAMREGLGLWGACGAEG